MLAADRAGDRLVALFVLDDVPLAAAGRFRSAQLAENLRALDASLAERGGRLRIERGRPDEVVPRIAAEIGAGAVFANADVSPYARARDGAVAAALDIPIHWSWGTYVHRPGSLPASSGVVSRVFTPFWKRWAATPWEPADDLVDRLGAEPRFVDRVGEVDVGELPTDAAPLRGGSEAAIQRLDAFVERVERYPTDRDVPAVAGTSGLSIDLHFGTISPRTVATVIGEATAARTAVVRQLAWRDWYAHLLWEQPQLLHRALRPVFDAVEWRDDAAGVEAWKQGRTGFPIVDAGMRQLATTGWMHNRARMICASFLVKDLLVDWRVGEAWFRELLVDYEPAQNAGNWQWVAGTGPDAAPYFRVFSPVTQSRTFDPDGRYIRRYVPELSALTSPAIHAPWELGPLGLLDAGITLGVDYPMPIVDHAMARRRALDAYAAARDSEAAGSPPRL